MSETFSRGYLMSTYTDLHLRKKENLTILRMPGNPYDGMTPQRVIFANPENIYNGTFQGKVHASSTTFDNVVLNDCSIVGGVLSNAALMLGNGQILQISDLTANISELQGYVYDLQKFQTSVEISCAVFDKNIFDLSNQVSALSNLRGSEISIIQNDISSLSNYIANLSSQGNTYGESISTLNENVNDLSNGISTLFDGIQELSTQNITQSKCISTLSGDLQSLSSEVSSHYDELTALQKQVEHGVVYKQPLKIDSGAASLSALFTVNGINNDSQLSVGYFYIAQTDLSNRVNSYYFDGVQLECGDWLMIAHDIIVSAITSTDVNVVDAQDYDTFKLTSDNEVHGNTTFVGDTVLCGDAQLSTATFTSTVRFKDQVEFQRGFVVDDQLVVQRLSGNEAAVIYADISSANISSTNIASANVQELTVNLQNVKYDQICSLQDLSDAIYTELSILDLSAQKTVEDKDSILSDILSIKLSCNDLALSVKTNADDANSKINYLSSELSNYHNTLSGIARAEDGFNDIKSDNLIVTDTIQYAGAHEHTRYYVTMISGAVVFKQING